MKYLVIAIAVLAILAAAQAQPFLPGLDIVEKAAGGVAGGVVGGATGAVKGAVAGAKEGLKGGLEGLADVAEKEAGSVIDIGREFINQ